MPRTPRSPAAALLLAAAATLLPAGPPASAACIPVPVQDHGARRLAADHLHLARDAMQGEDANLRIRRDTARSAGDRQRIAAAAAPLPAGEHLRRYLASIGALPETLGGLAAAGRPVRIAAHDADSPLLFALSALLPDLLLSRIPPSLRPVAQALLDRTGLLDAEPQRPFHSRTATRPLLIRRSWNLPAGQHQATGGLPPGTHAILHGRDAIRWLAHRDSGRHHADDSVRLPLSNGGIARIRLSDLYPVLDSLGITAAYRRNRQPPLPWPPRPLTQGDRLVLAAIGIRPPRNYGLPAHRHRPAAAAAAILNTLLNRRDGTSMPATGPVARAVLRCRQHPGCNPDALRARLSPAGAPAIHALALRFSRPSRQIHAALPRSMPPALHETASREAFAALLGMLPGSHASNPWLSGIDSGPLQLHSGGEAPRLDLSTSGTASPVDHLFAPPGADALQTGAAARARDAHLRHAMVDGLATAIQAATRIRDLDAAGHELPERLQSCESAVCALRTLQDAYRIAADSLALQARLEMALLRQALAERLSASDPLPVPPVGSHR